MSLQIPANAFVYLDTIYKGKTPLTITGITPEITWLSRTLPVIIPGIQQSVFPVAAPARYLQR